MYPFWESVIEPLVRTAGAQRIVEIGALRGETTAMMLDDLGPDAELHVIDPVPQFDPTEHEERFGGRYVFHRDLSLNVLPTSPAFDFALIDGDHNWYTVYNECRLLAEASAREGVALPLMVLHDVCWPYGRRDLYYDPSNVPDEGKQPYAYRGMRPGAKKLNKAGGMNVGLANALEEGGPRNGVRTGLDDFIAEHPTPIRQVILPIYYGLAIVADEEYLAAHPAVSDYLDQLESVEGLQQLVELSEAIRLDEVVFSHNVGRMTDQRLARAIDRHLDLLRASLLDEHYVENEARIDIAVNAAQNGNPVDPAVLRAPKHQRPPAVRELVARRAEGPDESGAGVFAYTDIGATRLEEIHEALTTVRSDGVAGDLVEVGCGRGGVGIYMRGFLDAHETADRDVWICDPFRAGPGGPERPYKNGGKADLWGDLNQVRDGFERYGLLDDRVRFVQGEPTESLPDAPIGTIALLRVGRHQAANAPAIVAALEARLADGAFVIVEDAAAVDVPDASERLGWSGAAWRHRAPDADAITPRIAGGPVPLAPAGPATDTLDLSVIVVFHNMSREAKRTLHTLSRGYQREIDDLRYEVIAIDNGSAPDQRLTEEFVRSFGAEFRFVDMGDAADPSPVGALNHGMQLARGQNLAFMIDGAHMLSPGVFRHAMNGLRAYAPAVVATQQWYVGPGQQPEMVGEAYNQEIEDQLFANIEWPADGYRLFEISHFIGDRDWLDGIIESNCLFASRDLLEQVGGFDEQFDMPGAGYANLELYERLGAHPGTKVVTILGEGSFHQVHGGITTNDGSIDDRRAKTFGYGEHYRDLRGRTLGGPGKHVHFVGSFAAKSAIRTRSRRLSAMAFDRPESTPGEKPETPTPIPDEVTASLIDHVWHTLAWEDTRWLGQPITKTPTDLVTYQELIAEIRPDHVVVVDRGGGSAAFAASICTLTGHGAVLCVGSEGADTERLTHIAGEPTAAATVDEVHRRVGDGSALVILGGGGRRQQLVDEFRAYSPLVSVGSYLIFEDTIVNGNPVWPGHGPGPLEAMRGLLPHHGEFVQATDVEKHGLTFNRGGYLRRTH